LEASELITLSNVLIDTGSTELVLAKKGCTTCSNYTLFDPSESSTYSKKPGDKYEASYSTGGNAEPLAKPASAKGQVISDTVSIGGLSVKHQPFFLAEDYPTELGENPLGPNIDGIFGVGPPGSSILGKQLGRNLSTTFWSLAQSGQLPKPLFGLALNSGDSSPGVLNLGGIDDSKYEGSLAYAAFNASVTAMYGQWFMNTPGFFVNQKIIKNSADNKGFSAGISIVDIGTAYIQTPDKQTAKDIYAAISPEIKMLDNLGVWGAPCEIMEDLEPELIFTIGEGDKLLNMTMPTDAFNLGEHPSHPGQCQGVILHAVEPISSEAEVWILGSPVLKPYYTVWNGESLELGVAKLKTSEMQTTPDPTPTPTDTTAEAGSLIPNWMYLGMSISLAFTYCH
jgi:hypothetical protein